MLKAFDRSPFIARLLQNVSGGLARRRGLPVVIGVVLVAISFLVHLINLSVGSPFLELIWTIAHHSGLLIALIGILLIEPIGR
jgi:hypothetical protein